MLGEKQKTTIWRIKTLLHKKLRRVERTTFVMLLQGTYLTSQCEFGLLLFFIKFSSSFEWTENTI